MPGPQSFNATQSVNGPVSQTQGQPAADVRASQSIPGDSGKSANGYPSLAVQASGTAMLASYYQCKEANGARSTSIPSEKGSATGSPAGVSNYGSGKGV